MRYKAGEALKVNYIALKRTIGLTDLEMQVFDEAGDEFLGSPFTMTEIAAPTPDDAIGLYTASFTPDAVGQWRIRIQSATNGDDISKIFDVQLTKEDDIKAQTQSIEDKEDIIDTVVDATKVVVDATKVVVDATKVVVDSIEDKVDIVDTVVDATKVVVDATKVVVDSIEDKTDIIDGNVDQALLDVAAVKAQTQSIEDKIDDIDLQISSGGYIL